MGSKLCRMGWVILAAALFGWVPTIRAQQVFDASQYWRLLEETIILLHSDDPAEADLEAAAARWEAVEQVRTPNGDMQPVDASYIASKLRDPETNRQRLRSDLESILARQRTFQRPTTGTSENQTLLNEVLSDDAFDYSEDEPNFVERLWARLVGWILNLLGRLIGSTPLQQFSGGLITIFAVLALTVVLFFVVRMILRDFVSEAELEESLEREKVLTADSALSRAQTFSEEGDYRTAVRYLYLSCLLSLEERGLLRYDRSLTNREYLRSVAHVPELANLLRDVVNIFDRVWYGYQPITSETYNKYAAQVQALRRRT